MKLLKIVSHFPLKKNENKTNYMHKTTRTIPGLKTFVPRFNQQFLPHYSELSSKNVNDEVSKANFNGVGFPRMRTTYNHFSAILTEGKIIVVKICKKKKSRRKL